MRRKWIICFTSLESVLICFFLCLFFKSADASQPKAIRMAGSSRLDNQSEKDLIEEPFFSTLDIILLGSLLIAAAWWLFRRNKQEEYTPSTKSYSIQ